MLTVWSWEADSEVLMERSVGEENVHQAGGRLNSPQLCQGALLSQR